MSRLGRVGLLTLVALGGCGGGDHDDLRQWMAESTKDLRGGVPKLPQIKPYEPVPYTVEGRVDPFSRTKLEPDSKYKNAGKGGAFQPDFEAREMRNSMLEKYPLESIKLIGIMNMNNHPMAVVSVDDKVKQIKLGEYMGLDFGMVTKITDAQIELRELVQDAAGDWSERTSTLLLQGKEVKK